jgi:hypothetical protein
MPTLRAQTARLSPLALVLVSVAGFVAPLAVGCSDADNVYKPTPAYSGRKADIPSVPALPTTPIRAGDTYTIFGAIHQLRSRYHAEDVTKKDITIQGYIVDTNIPTAPPCAVHPVGKKDPDDCKSDIPSFWIADTKGDKAGQKIRVIGWASNFANVSEAVDKYKDLKEPPKHADKPDDAGKAGFLVMDENWANDIPYPVPALGARVKVTGTYGVSSQKASSGLVTDPTNGIMTYKSMDTSEPPAEPAVMSKPGPGGAAAAAAATKAPAKGKK